jgi:hypothetical protein
MHGFVQVLAILGYVVGMTWATALAPSDARWPTVLILHGAFALGYLVRHHKRR